MNRGLDLTEYISIWIEKLHKLCLFYLVMEAR